MIESVTRVGPQRGFVMAVVTIVALAALLRMVSLSSEPFWLDEVCTFEFSSGSPGAVLEACARDTHPPLYFLEVAALRSIFGHSERTLRSLSVATSLLGILLLMAFARDVGGRCVCLAAGVLAACNPMDLYYAQEARMYSQAALLATGSAWFLWRWLERGGDSNRRDSRWAVWAGLYCCAAVMLCLTHLVGTMVLVAQGLFALVVLLSRKRIREGLAFVFIGGASCAAVGAWALFVIRTRGVFVSPAVSGWIPSVGIDESFRFLVDHFFFSFSGLRGGGLTSFLSTVAWAVVALVFLWSLFGPTASRRLNSEGEAEGSGSTFNRMYLLWLIVGPVAIAVLVSRLGHPIFYPPRFGLLVLAPFLILAASLCCGIRPKFVGVALFALTVGLMSVGSAHQLRTTSKFGMDHFADLWHSEGPPDVALFVPGHRRRLAAYAVGREIPRVVRSTLEGRLRSADSLKIWVCAEFGAPAVTERERTLAAWAASLGPSRQLGTRDRMEITEILVGKSSLVFPPLPDDGRISFAGGEAEPFLLSGWCRPESKHRWTRGRRAEMLFSLEKPDRLAALSMRLFAYRRQRVTLVLNDVEIGSFVCDKRSPHRHEVSIPEGVLRTENIVTLLLPDAVAPREVSDSRDGRVLAVGLRWLTFEEAPAQPGE